MCLHKLMDAKVNEYVHWIHDRGLRSATTLYTENILFRKCLHEDGGSVTIRA